jgi:hypothetical protein
MRADLRAELSLVGMPRQTLDLLTALSHGTSLSIGCSCENETCCHLSVLRERLADRGASLGSRCRGSGG